jgi:hypothetical protein
LRAGDGRARKGVEQKDGARYVYLERASIVVKYSLPYYNILNQCTYKSHIYNAFINPLYNAIVYLFNYLF